MRICITKAAMRTEIAQWRQASRPVGLVPTMGYLHDGHLALVRSAKARADGAKVAVSIFVNPTQFGPTEDFASYPRDTDRDLALLRDAGADAVFLPDAAEMYGEARETIVETTRLSRVLMGRLRPGHFRGVATVVTKLFNIVQPDFACFGEKDYQQLCVIRRMVADLDMPVEIVGVPTVREADGLAMSSRNVRLAPEDRAAAPVLHQALREGAALIAKGSTAKVVEAALRARIAAEPRADIRSVDVRDAATLAALRGPIRHPAVMLLAVRFGSVLLIDQSVAAPT